MNVNTYKNLFILEEGLTYLNCANMSPMLVAVKEAGLRAINTRAAPWKISAENWFTDAEKLRELAAEIFQTSDHNIALIPSASYGLAVAAKNFKLPAGKEIILLDQQFPSNYYVWENLAAQQNLQMVTIVKSDRKTLTESIIEKISGNTGVIAIPNCHWIDGRWIDLQKIRDASAASGAYLVLDLSQSLGALPVDIESVQPDFAVAVGYKWLLGPYGLSYMYVSKKWQEAGEPLEYSWMTKKGSEDFTGLTGYISQYRDGARKFDMGEFSQFHLLPMAIAALEQVINWRPGFIQAEIKKLTERVIIYKKEMGIFDNTESAGHIASIPVNIANIKDVKNRLEKNKIVISFRGPSIRVSPHIYNDHTEIERLISCLKE